MARPMRSASTKKFADACRYAYDSRACTQHGHKGAFDAGAALIRDIAKKIDDAHHQHEVERGRAETRQNPHRSIAAACDADHRGDPDADHRRQATKFALVDITHITPTPINPIPAMMP